jgi:transcription elongation GreA/GreB family factor
MFKQKIYAHYLKAINRKISALRQQLDSLQESLEQETKSTAGDKYETGRAMVHIEQENTGRQYEELLLQKAELESIDITAASAVVVKGSLVEADRGYFFLSVAQGKAMVEGQTVYALSPVSPLGQKLMGRTAGDTIKMNEVNYFIKKVY